MKKLLAMLAVGAALFMSADNLLAQDTGGGGGGGNGGGGRRNGGGGGGNFDPAQFQQRMMDRYKEQLGFTNDTDWSAVEPLVLKVVEARRDLGAGRFGGFGGGRRGGGGGGGGQFGGTPNPDAEALQSAIDANAPAAQIKTALEKYRTSQKAKQAKLEQAQANLRKVLSQKQEAQAVLGNLLD